MARQDGKDESSNELETSVYGSFPQDWLNAEDLEEQVARNLPQTVARIPSFLEEDVKSDRTKSRSWNRELLRKALFSSSMFALGVVCTLALDGSSVFDNTNDRQTQIAEEPAIAEVQGENELVLSDDSVVQFSSSRSYENSTSSNAFNNSLEFGDLSSSASLNPQYDNLYASRPANFDGHDSTTANASSSPQAFDDDPTVEETAFPTWADLAPHDEEVTSQVATTSQELSSPNARPTEEASLPGRFEVSQELTAPIQAQGGAVMTSSSPAPSQFQAFSTAQSPSVPNVVSSYNERNNYTNDASFETLASNASNVDISQKNVYNSHQRNSDSFRQNFEARQASPVASPMVEPQYEARNDASLYQDRWSQNMPTEGQEVNVPQASESAPLYSEAIPTFDNPHPEVQNGVERQAYVAQNYEEPNQSAPRPAATRSLRW